MHTWLREKRIPTFVGHLIVVLDELFESTCLDCPLADQGCEFAWDAYNTHGDCLAEK